MARLTVPGFSGVVKITAPQRLEDYQAQIAVDCDFRSQDLRPYYGDRQTGYSGSGADPSTLYLYDQGKLIVEAGDWNFARSPVFFSDSKDNDRRVFYADARSDSGFPMTLETFASSGPLPAGNKRLGVPKPGPFRKDPEAEVRSGTIYSVTVKTRPPSDNSSGHNTWLGITTALPDSVKVGTKILVTYPGMENITYTIGEIAEDRMSFSLKSTGLPLKVASKVGTIKEGDFTNKLKSGEPVWIKMPSGNPANLADGDQVVVTFGVGGPTSHGGKVEAAIPRNRVYYVKELGGDRFKLGEADGSDFTAKAKYNDSGDAVVDDSHPFWFAKAAAADNPFPAGMQVAVYDKSVEITYVKTADETGTWEDAASADLVRSRSYCMTFVNAAGDESEPGFPTEPFEVVPGSSVTFPGGCFPVTAQDPSKYPLSEYADAVKLRLYRTDELGTFRLVTTEEDDASTITRAEVLDDNFVYVDSKPDAELGEPLQTTGWSAPVQGLRGLTNCPNGVIAAFRGRTVFGSVPYAPYAWPITNQVALDYDVVGLVPTSAGIVVVTKGMPALLIGDNPANWSMQKLEYPQGCVSRRSIVDMGEFAIYASPDGLVAVTGASVEVLTKSIMTREQWQAYSPSTIVAGQSEGRYIGTYGSGSGRKGFIYDPQTQSFTDLTLNSVAFCNNLLEDVLYILNPNGRVYEWNQDTSTYKPYFWRSKWFQLPIPEIMGVAQIFTTTIGLSGRSLKFTLHGYDNNVSQVIYEISTSSNPNAILGNRPFRIPYVAPGRFTAFMVTLEGSIPVGTVMIGRVMDELKEAP